MRAYVVLVVKAESHPYQLATCQTAEALAALLRYLVPVIDCAHVRVEPIYVPDPPAGLVSPGQTDPRD